MMKLQSLAGNMKTDGSTQPNSLLPGILGFLLFLSLGLGVEWFLFEYRQERAAELVSAIAIPGGNWRLAVKSVIEPTAESWPLLFRVLGWLFAALFATLAVASWTLNRKLQDQALYDRLTGLPSRHLFLDRLKQVIRRTRRNQRNFSILFINLIDFKSVNESHGIKVGDMMLAGIGKRMIGFIRHCDTVTRWGGDEFLILLDDCPHDQANVLAENLRHQIELPVYCGEHKLRIGPSIGIATFPDHGHSLTALLKVANGRMVKDKTLRKNLNGNAVECAGKSL